MLLNDLEQRVKNRLQPEGIAEDDLAFVIGQETFPALEQLARECARDPSQRHFFLTSPASVTAVLDGTGAADLSSLVTNNGILIDCLQYGEVFPPVSDAYPTQPFRIIENRQQALLSGMLDGLVLKAWREGNLLKTKSPSNNVEPLSGSVSFKVPRVPTLAEVPATLEGRVVDLVAERLSGRITRQPKNK